MEIQAKKATELINLAALHAAHGLAPTANNISRVAAIHGQEAAAWAFNQWLLREKARRKFSNAEQMLFTPVGLEQASHEAVARYHASLFPANRLVADLTCGIGGDLLALSERGQSIGFETEATTAVCAAHNAPDAEVMPEDSLQANWDFDYAFADPSRRSGSRRTLDPEAFSPNPTEVATRMEQLKFGLMKLSPMLSDNYLRSLSDSVEFVSFGWECREALAWFHENEAFGTRAVKIENGEKLAGGGFASATDQPSHFIYEADPAAIRAHCLPNLCEQLRATLLGDSNGYLTSESCIQNCWVKAYELVEQGAFDLKRVRSLLKAHGGGTPEIKSRAKVDVIDLRRKLATVGATKFTLILYPIQKSIRFALVLPH